MPRRVPFYQGNIPDEFAIQTQRNFQELEASPRVFFEADPSSYAITSVDVERLRTTATIPGNSNVVIVGNLNAQTIDADVLAILRITNPLGAQSTIVPSMTVANSGGNITVSGSQTWSPTSVFRQSGEYTLTLSLFISAGAGTARYAANGLSLTTWVL